MTIAIHAEGLSKKYLIGQSRARQHDTLRDELMNCWRRIGWRSDRKEIEEFWALRDVSFEIKAGDKVGIIGRNGAGKSTLLKILSRITEPSAGRVTIRGRVTSLLEVGTGFHPELTGRENIYLNGAILGMRRHEIQKKFDEIVDFAEVERFLDTPVKRYSSGMYVRLAFAVAAHLDPEILIVDEVLAVGDAAFQKKCLERMNQFGRTGTTVLFVSHNIAAIQSLCQSAILLGHGRMLAHGNLDDVMARYMHYSRERAGIAIGDRDDRSGSGVVRFHAFELLDDSGRMVRAFQAGRDAKIRFHYASTSAHGLKNVVFAIGVDNARGERLTYLSNDIAVESFSNVPDDVKGFEVEIVKLPLVPGSYRFTIYCSVNGELADWVQNAGEFDVEPGDFFGTGKLPPADSQGSFFLQHRFNFHHPEN